MSKKSVFAFLGNCVVVLAILWTLDFGLWTTQAEAADTTIKGTTADSTAASLNVTNSADTSLLYVRNSGNVGIGTTGPGEKLTVSGGNISLTTANSIITGATGLTLQETEDTYGTVKLHLQNRTGVNGAMFEQAGSVDLVDLVFKSLSSQRNIRFEDRPGFIFAGDPEFQIGTVGNPTLVIGDSVSAFRSGNVGIGTTNPNSILHAVSVGNTTAGSKAFQLVGGGNTGSAGGMQYGLYVTQTGARYSGQVGIYGAVDPNMGQFGDNYYGVYGYSPLSSQAYQTSAGIYGQSDSTSWNYNSMYGVKGLARPGTSTFGAQYASHAGYGGHFTSHGLGNSVGVYADAYLDAGADASSSAVPLIVASNGAEKFRVSSSGNVGIGTTGPVAKLDITSSGALAFGTTTEKIDLYGNDIRLTARGEDTSTARSIWFGKAADGWNFMHIETDAPSGFSFRQGGEMIGNFAVSGKLGAGVWSATNTLDVGGAAAIGASYAGTVAPSNGMIIQGNVGIGTTNPNAILTIHSATDPRISFFPNDNTYSIRRSGTTMIMDSSGYSRITAVASTFLEARNGFITMATGSGAGTLERMRIDSTGNVGIGTTSPNAAALLDVTSKTKGFLPPRMTTVQRDAITTPPAGLMIYNTTTNKLNFYNGSAWEAVTSI